MGVGHRILEGAMKTTIKAIDIAGSTDRHCYGPDGRCPQMDLAMQYRCPCFGYLRTELVSGPNPEDGGR